MKFFVPGTKDRQEAQHLWDATKKFAEETLNWKVTDRRIFSIAHRDEGKNTFVQVGKPESYENGEIVLVILETNGPYFVCTQNRGVQRGMPFLVGKEEVYQTTDFEE